MLNVIIKASSRYPIRRKRIKDVVAKVLEVMEMSGRIELELEVVGDRKMRQLKRKHLGIDETTDVLSFPLHDFAAKRINSGFTSGKAKFDHKNVTVLLSPDGMLRLGNIVISYPQARRQANVHHLLLDDEIDQLVEHGMWHLLGIHHD